MNKTKMSVAAFGVLALLGAALVAAPPAFAASGPYYVSPSGNDSNPGTVSAPFKTIERARDVVSTVNSSMGAPIVVYLRGGEYVLDQTIVFDASDSGQNGHRITYAAYADEKPIISGGYKLSGWTRIAGGLDIWKATVPAGFKTRDLYVDGARAEIAGTVNGLQPDANQGGSLGSGDPFVGAEWQQTSTGYVVHDARPQAWGAGVEFVWSGIGANTTNGWAEPRCRVASVAPKSGASDWSVITMEQPCYANVTTQKNEPAFAVREPSRIEGMFYNNDFRTQMAPGQWLHSAPDQGIFYYPHAWEDMSSVKAVAGRLEVLVKFDGTPTAPVHDIAFEGLTFRNTTWLAPNDANGFAETQANVYQVGAGCDATTCEMRMPVAAIDLKSTTDVDLSGLNISNIGSTAVRMWDGAHSNSLSHSSIRDSGTSCVAVGHVIKNNPATEAERDRGNTISYNTLDGCAVRYRGGVGIFAGYVADTTILNNEIKNTSYSGISLGWGWGVRPTYINNNRIHGNNIHDTMLAAPAGLIDGGGIYLNGQTATSNGAAADRNKVTNNWVHNQGRSIAAIYLDSGASRWDVTGNVVERSDGVYWYLLGGTYNSVWDNWTDTQPGRVLNGDSSNQIGTNVTGISTWPAAAETVKEDSGP